MGVRLRITLTATAAVAAALCLASVTLFAVLDASLSDSTRRAASQDAENKAVLMRSDFDTLGCYSGDPVGRTDDGESGARQEPPPARATCSRVMSVAEVAAGHRAGKGVARKDTFRITSVRKIVQTPDGPVTVTGTASTEPASAALATLRGVLLPGVPALLALVALATWLAVGRVLRPVSAIRAKVADITAYDLHERVPEPATGDEVAALARTVNATLDRLRTAVEAHRQFVADAAHELRSPMAVLRTRLELAGPGERRLAAAALDDVQRVQALTADLLLLARLDAREPPRTAEFDLAQVVAEEAARTRPRTDVRVALRLAPDLLLDGSADRVRRLVANLVDNAVRHAAGTVHVTLTAGDGRAVLDVADDGPGIPAEYHATVFDRFTRLDHARTRDTGGSGLGLSIARDIARSHGGTLEVVAADDAPDAPDEPDAPDRPDAPDEPTGGSGGARLRAVLPLARRPTGARPPGRPSDPDRRGVVSAG